MNSIVDFAKSLPTGSQRPPRCAARNASATAVNELRFSERPRPWPSSVLLHCGDDLLSLGGFDAHVVRTLPDQQGLYNLSGASER